jgi:hypothetical protein
MVSTTTLLLLVAGLLIHDTEAAIFSEWVSSFVEGI